MKHFISLKQEITAMRRTLFQPMRFDMILESFSFIE